MPELVNKLRTVLLEPFSVKVFSTESRSAVTESAHRGHEQTQAAMDAVC